MPQAAVFITAELNQHTKGNQIFTRLASAIEFEFALLFTDARNNRWLRNRDYTLAPIESYSFGNTETYVAAMAKSRFESNYRAGLFNQFNGGEDRQR